MQLGEDIALSSKNLLEWSQTALAVEASMMSCRIMSCSQGVLRVGWGNPFSSSYASLKTKPSNQGLE